MDEPTRKEGQVAAGGEEGPLRFEDIVAQLEDIVRKLEQGDLPIEESIALFERGNALVQRGNALLDQAEKRIEIVLDDGQGEGGPQVAPFDPDTGTVG